MPTGRIVITGVPDGTTAAQVREFVENVSAAEAISVHRETRGRSGEMTGRVYVDVFTVSASVDQVAAAVRGWDFLGNEVWSGNVGNMPRGAEFRGQAKPPTAAEMNARISRQIDAYNEWVAEHGDDEPFYPEEFHDDSDWYNAK